MGRYDLNQIIILFFIYLSNLWVEKLEELSCRSILAVGPNLEIWVQKKHLKYFGAILRHKTTLFYGPNLPIQLPSIFYTLIPFQWCKKLPQSEFACESYASYKLTYCIDHHGVSGCHINLHYCDMWGYPRSLFSRNILGGPKPYHN